MEKFRPWLAEFIGTFALIFVGIGAIKTAGHDVLGIALAHGLTIAVFASATMHISGGNLNPAVTFGLLFGGPLTGAAMNPARVFGPALASWFWHDHYVYWIGPLIGAALGGFVYGLFIERKPAAA